MSNLRKSSPWTRAMIGVLAIAAVAVGITVASASGADPKDSDTSEQGDVTFAPGPAPAAIEDFKDCMADHGVDVPEPGELFDGPREVHEPSAEEREAFEACGDELPRPPHGAFMVPPPMDGKAAKQLRACASKHGVDLPARPPRPPVPGMSGDDG